MTGDLSIVDIAIVWQKLSIPGTWSSYIGDLDAENPTGKLVISKDCRRWSWPTRGFEQENTHAFIAYAVKHMMNLNYMPLGIAKRLHKRWDESLHFYHMYVYSTDYSKFLSNSHLYALKLKRIIAQIEVAPLSKVINQVVNLSAIDKFGSLK